jgi:Uma2 family endonuclease
MAALPLNDNIDYPESDGRPLGETERHRQEIVDLIYGLQRHFRESPDVYVGGDMFIYYTRGNPRAVVCPDVFVVRGVDKTVRDTFKVWEEDDRRPGLVIEVTSASSRKEDLMDKKSLYALLGVEEYFLFDPREEYLFPSLQGFRLQGGRYVPITPDRDGSLRSETTGLLLRRDDDGRSRLVDAATGARLPRIDELEGLHLSAEARADEEAAARRAAEARAEAAEEELARLRRELAQRMPG